MNIGSLKIGLLAGLAAFVTVAQADVTIYVASVGKDAWAGTLKTPNKERTNGPKKTLVGARDELRRLRASGKIEGTATVVLANGTYTLSDSFTLELQDSGTPNSPVIWKAASPKGAILDGGRQVTIWTKVAKSTSARLKPEVSSFVKQANLRLMKVKEFKRGKRGFDVVTSEYPVELFFENQRQTLAQFPNNGWMKVQTTADGQRVFNTGTDRPRNWPAGTEAYVHGFFGWNWADSTQKLGRWDPATWNYELEEKSSYGIKPNQRVKLVNVLEELDSPGEYFIDAKKGIAYWYPPVTSVGRRSSISLVENPVVFLNNTSNIRLEGLVIQNGRTSGIDVYYGSNTTIVGCTLRNLGTMGVFVRGGTNNTIDSCDISGTGESPVKMYGGSRATLTPGNNSVRNCFIYNYAELVPTGRAGIDLYGVGNIVSHNRFQNAPHMAVWIHGNDHLIEANEISNVCKMVGDAGAIYIGRDWSEQGNVIRKNLIVDVRGTLPNPYDPRLVDSCWGIYLDDLASGTFVEGNIVKRTDQGVQVGGGRDNTVNNNVFIDCDKGIHADSRGISWAYYMDAQLNAKLATVPYTSSPWSTKYPSLVNILQDEPMKAKRNLAQKNVAVGASSLFELLDNINPQSTATDPNAPLYSIGNYFGSNPGFVNIDANDFSPLPGSPAEQIGFEALTGTSIGLQQNEFRPAVTPFDGGASSHP